jgi:peptide/nickel transport system ATP-binding protein
MTAQPAQAALLAVDALHVDYPLEHGRRLNAVAGVSFSIARGETLGLVGESGCGKSSVGRAVLRLESHVRGSVRFDGHDLYALDAAALRALRSRMQIIFQDPIASLNPRRRIGDTVAEPLRIAGVGDRHELEHRVRAVLHAVGLDPDTAMPRRPHQFSGGQCQRIAIARALVLEPQFVVCDEPVSSLDVSVQAEVLNLLEEMRSRFGLTLLFISHDLAVINSVADRVAVMYLGRICELGGAQALFSAPAHPYTAALLSAIPGNRQRPRGVLAGELPSALDPPSGCRFRTRCPRAQPECAAREPALTEVTSGHHVACLFPLLS